MIRPEILALCVTVGLATYLIRFLPFLMARRLQNREDATARSSPGSVGIRVLELIGPSVVVALLVTAILPQPGESDFGPQFLRSLLALVPTLAVAILWRSLGLTVLAGIGSYWLISLLV